MHTLQVAAGWCWEASLHASVIAIVILAIRGLVRHRLPARWMYALWFVLLVRLVMPWAPESPTSLFNIVRRLDATGLERVEKAQNAMEAPPPGHLRLLVPEVLEKHVEPTLVSSSSPALPSAASRLMSGSSALALVWFVGVMAFVTHAAWSSVRFARRLRPYGGPYHPALDEAMVECERLMRVRKPVRAWVTKSVSTPALWGFWRPRLLMPPDLLEELPHDELRFVVLHELAHLKRRDILVNWIVTVIQALHWFNPLVWYAFHRMRIDRELACDAAVLSRLHPEDAPRYGHTVLRLFEQARSWQLAPGVAGIAEGKSQLKRRIAMIASFRKGTVWHSAVAVALLATLAAVGLTTAAANDTLPQGMKPSEDSGGASSSHPAVAAARPSQAVPAQEPIAARLAEKVNVQLKSPTLGEFLNALEKKTGLTIEPVGIAEANAGNRQRPCSGQGMSVRDALKAGLGPMGLEYQIWNGKVLVGTAEDLRKAVQERGGESNESPESTLKEVLARPMTLSIPDGTLNQVLDLLAERAGINIVLDNRASDGSVSIKGMQVKDTPLWAVLDRIFAQMKKEEQLHLAYAIQPGFVWISTPARIQTESFEELETRYYSFPDKTPADLAAIVRTFDLVLPSVFDPKTGDRLSGAWTKDNERQIAVRNTPTNHERIGELLVQLGVVSGPEIPTAALSPSAEALEPLKTLGLAFKTYANEHRGNWPGADKPGHFAVPLDVLAEYIDEPTHREWWEKNRDRFIYMGYVTIDDVTGMDLLKRHRQAVATGQPLAPEGTKSPIEGGLPIKEGVERFFITDINNPAAAATTQAQIPVVVELPKGDSGHVLYMDGHVERLPFPGRYPMSHSFIDGIREFVGAATS